MPAVQTVISAVSKLAPVWSSAGGRMRPPGATLRGPLAAAEGAYMRAGLEPPLEEVLSDPIVRALMRSDGVEPAEVRRVLRRAQRRSPPG